MNLVDDLLNAKLVSQKELKLYKLFKTRLGQECLEEMAEEIFWEEPTESQMTAGVLGFYQGRLSFLRSIKTTVQKVDYLIHQKKIEAIND